MWATLIRNEYTNEFLSKPFQTHNRTFMDEKYYVSYNMQQLRILLAMNKSLTMEIWNVVYEYCKEHWLFSGALATTGLKGTRQTKNQIAYEQELEKQRKRLRQTQQQRIKVVNLTRAYLMRDTTVLTSARNVNTLPFPYPVHEDGSDLMASADTDTATATATATATTDTDTDTQTQTQTETQTQFTVGFRPYLIASHHKTRKEHSLRWQFEEGMVQISGLKIRPQMNTNRRSRGDAFASDIHLYCSNDSTCLQTYRYERGIRLLTDRAADNVQQYSRFARPTKNNDRNRSCFYQYFLGLDTEKYVVPQKSTSSNYNIINNTTKSKTKNKKKTNDEFSNFKMRGKYWMLLIMDGWSINRGRKIGIGAIDFQGHCCF